MPKLPNATPDNLKPYRFHGLDLHWRGNDKEAVSDCLFCGKDGKFSVNIETGQWRCFSCNEGKETGEVIQGGNIYVFIRKLWEMSFDATTGDCYDELALDRRLLNGDGLMMWGLAKSISTDDWLVPGYNEEGKLQQLYRYHFVEEKNRFLLHPTPTLGHKLLGPQLMDNKKPIVDLVEGVWDAIAYWEVLRAAKQGDAGLVSTANPEASLLSQGNIIAVPSNNTFFPSWCSLFSGKIVNLMAHNDHPRKHPKTGAVIPSASYSGMERIAKLLQESESPPSEINLLCWGDETYNLELPSGFDLRDCLSGVV